jgi:hypothetical protein
MMTVMPSNCCSNARYLPVAKTYGGTLSLIPIEKEEKKIYAVTSFGVTTESKNLAL